MLTIYRSNKAEWLADVLGHHLRLSPPGMTEEVEIIVSTWPSSRWLSEKLSQINNITVFYANDNTLNIAWLPSNDWDFKSYKLEHRLFHESDDNWNLIWYSDSIDNAFYCSPCNEQDTIQFVPSTDQEIFNLFKL